MSSFSSRPAPLRLALLLLLLSASRASRGRPIINILPLPALDGGQLAFLLVEALRGKPLPMRVQENVMQTGLFLLLWRQQQG